MWVSTHTKKFDLTIFSSLGGPSTPLEVRLWTQVSVPLGGSASSSGLLRLDIDHGASKSIWLAGGLVNGRSWAERWGTVQSLFACLLNLNTDRNALEVSPAHTMHAIGTWGQQEPCFLYSEQEQSRGSWQLSELQVLLMRTIPSKSLSPPGIALSSDKLGYSW